MTPIRVLIVDDSSVFRTTLSKVMESSAHVVGADTAPDGKIALQKIQSKKPDIVILDVEMPGMDGIETLREIKKRWPDQKVIMFSAHTQKGAASTIDALSLGALDFLAKPSGGTLAENKRIIEEQLLPKIEGIFNGGPVRPARPAPSAVRPAPRVPLRATAGRRFERANPPIVAIGVSTGGPNALAELIPSLPASFPSPIAIVQHMPPLFTNQLANRLNTKSALSVHEATEGLDLRPGNVYIAPGDYHMEIRKAPGSKTRTIHLQQEPPECSCRPSVDVMFRSIAESYGANTIAVILTGMGQDGFQSTRLLKSCDCHVIAQDQASCVVYGMPSFIVQNGLADDVLPLNRIGRRLIELVQG
ncbi:MAG: chemotaxis response regulator protein-glutamate methylesterase [Candidatus Omnitrophica bacterium]|nr:chemotaxis response regulator protein-glutamate methylesterase [Candidatus Omnitrophota bacterium]MCA9446308.1 chemotaxis response regulator protein-glutamate methylesterase [Candidatus Omnitrophota bacterium]